MVSEVGHGWAGGVRALFPRFTIGNGLIERAEERIVAKQPVVR